MRCLAATALVLTLGLPASAMAKDRVLLVDNSSPLVAAPLREQVLTGLVSGLSKEGLEPIRPPRDPGAALQKKVLAGLAEAKKLAQRFQEAEALAAVVEVESTFRAAVAEQVSVEPLVAALLTRVKLEVDAGDGTAVRRTLERLAVLDPKLTLDPGTFVPQLVSAFAGVLRKALARKGQLKVTSTPSGLPVWIDGRKREGLTTPAQLGLHAGEHLVAVGERGRSRGKLVVVEPGQLADVRLAFGEVDDNRLRRAGNSAAAAWVVVFRLVGAADGKHRVKLRVLSARTVEVAREASSKPFALAQSTWAVSKLVLAARPLLGIEPTEPVEPAPPPPSSSGGSIFKKWWFWAAVGGVVATGAGVTTAVLLTRDRSVRLRLVP